MNRLSFPELLDKIAASPSAEAVRGAFREGRFPLEVASAEGAFPALLTALLAQEGGAFLAVTPTDTEAAQVAADLESAGVQAAVFPWWGTMPYREAAPNSAVFGERAACLAEMLDAAEAGAEARVFIASERAFLGPLPPPDYLRGLLIPLEPGGALDTQALAAALALYGCTRVPRAQVPGEFALRGEVLDIVMGGGGQGAAYRVLLDFDRVESIRRFNPLDQSGGEAVGRLVIRPMKEVVWTDERVEALGRVLAACEEFPEGGRRTRESLAASRSAPGEELFYALAFCDGKWKVENGKWIETASREIRTSHDTHDEKQLSANNHLLSTIHHPPSTLKDYLPPGSTVFFFDRERLENAQEALEREYQSLYGKARREREVPAPRRLLLDFKTLAAACPRRVSFVTIAGGGEAGATRLSAACDPPRSFFGNIDYLREEFASLLKQNWEIVIAAESEVQAGRMSELFRGEWRKVESG